METKNRVAKLSYEAPVLLSMEVELEYGIASGSGATNSPANQQWKGTETQSQTADSNPW